LLIVILPIADLILDTLEEIFGGKQAYLTMKFVNNSKKITEVSGFLIERALGRASNESLEFVRPLKDGRILMKTIM
jgi:hypothetical protein